jgi:hypothetical protein
VLTATLAIPLSHTVAGVNTPTNISGQPNAVDSTDSAVITDEWHGTCINIGVSNSDAYSMLMKVYLLVNIWS